MENLKSILNGDFRLRRRSNRDRRKEEYYVDFPVKTLEGYVVHKDRRFKPERRLRNIRVSENILNEAEFRKIFKKAL